MVKKYIQFIGESNQLIGGKNLFKCFLKTLSALGLKDTRINIEKSPDEFLYYFLSKSISVDSLKSIMSRYTQFNHCVNSISYTHNDCEIYYGITSELKFEYGIKTEDQKIIIGNFPITKGILNWMLVLESPSSINLKKILVGMDLNFLSILSKVKKSMSEYRIGQTEKRSKPIINDSVISFGYYGYGKWENGEINSSELENIKLNFKNFLSKNKWVDKVQVSVTAKDFWIYLNIKIK